MFKIDESKQKELQDKLCCHSYKEFLQDQCGGYIPCDKVADHFPDALYQINGDEEAFTEALSFYIIYDADFAVHCTNEPIFWDAELEVYVWARTFGNDFDSICPDLVESQPRPDLADNYPRIWG